MYLRKYLVTAFLFCCAAAHAHESDSSQSETSFDFEEMLKYQNNYCGEEIFKKDFTETNILNWNNYLVTEEAPCEMNREPMNNDFFDSGYEFMGASTARRISLFEDPQQQLRVITTSAKDFNCLIYSIFNPNLETAKHVLSPSDYAQFMQKPSDMNPIRRTILSDIVDHLDCEFVGECMGLTVTATLGQILTPVAKERGFDDLFLYLYHCAENNPMLDSILISAMNILYPELPLIRLFQPVMTASGAEEEYCRPVKDIMLVQEPYNNNFMQTYLSDRFADGVPIIDIYHDGPGGLHFSSLEMLPRGHRQG